MKIRFLGLFIFCLFQLSPLKATIVETPFFTDLLSFIDEDTWLLVDLDNTLFEGKQAYGHANHFYDEMQKRLDKGMSKEEAINDYYPEWILSQKRCEVKPLESSAIATLIQLQHRGITIMGLTHRQPCVADSTLRQIESLGLSFLKTAPSAKILSIPAKHPALYTHGVLFVHDFNLKSEIFFPFLDLIQLSPKKVVFIDDKRKNVEEMETAMARTGIEYVGIHYTAIYKADPVYSPEVAALQRRLLDKVISNKAALLLMEHGLE